MKSKLEISHEIDRFLLKAIVDLDFDEHFNKVKDPLDIDMEESEFDKYRAIFNEKKINLLRAL